MSSPSDPSKSAAARRQGSPSAPSAMTWIPPSSKGGVARGPSSSPPPSAPPTGSPSPPPPWRSCRLRLCRSSHASRADRSTCSPTLILSSSVASGIPTSAAYTSEEKHCGVSRCTARDPVRVSTDSQLGTLTAWNSSSRFSSKSTSPNSSTARPWTMSHSDTHRRASMVRTCRRLFSTACLTIPGAPWIVVTGDACRGVGFSSPPCCRME
mmetsp:Transcript_56720/g.179244  ORF Transcript_56720/g.179244 Transcript_56720/m.179244 type:complete len:210 (-) Transcript_56720:1208-1837(-)